MPNLEKDSKATGVTNKMEEVDWKI
jgi:hypothetical protein